jgi:nucleoid-associated protein YgaU
MTLSACSIFHHGDAAPRQETASAVRPASEPPGVMEHEPTATVTAVERYPEGANPSTVPTRVVPDASAINPTAPKSYTVKKGDTLFSIAKSRYGNGNQYTKIVSANPGLSPQSLKAGQTITIP